MEPIKPLKTAALILAVIGSVWLLTVVYLLVFQGVSLTDIHIAGLLIFSIACLFGAVGFFQLHLYNHILKMRSLSQITADLMGDLNATESKDWLRRQALQDRINKHWQQLGIGPGYGASPRDQNLYERP